MWSGGAHVAAHMIDECEDHVMTATIPGHRIAWKYAQRQPDVSA